MVNRVKPRLGSVGGPTSTYTSSSYIGQATKRGEPQAMAH